MNRILELVLPNILGPICATVGAAVLGWMRERRKRSRVSREARNRVQTLEDSFSSLRDRVDSALDGLRQDGAAWKACQAMLLRVEKLETRQTSMHQEMLAAIEAAHETARSAVNSVKGQKGGRRAAAAAAPTEGTVDDWAQFGQGVDQLMKTPQGRAQLIREIQQMENGAASSPVAGDFSPPPA